MRFPSAGSAFGAVLLFAISVPATAQQDGQDQQRGRGADKQQQRQQPQQNRSQEQRSQPPQRGQQPEARPQRERPQRPQQSQQQPQQTRQRPQPSTDRQQTRRMQPQPQRTQQQARIWQQKRGWLQQGGGWQGRNNWQQARAQNWASQHRNWAQRGGYGGYYIPQDRFRLSFGSQHYFRLGSLPVMYMGYPRFAYGGFSFLMVDPWPEYWSANWYQSDDVYIDYDDGYYLYNRRYPNVRLAITVAL